MVRTLPRRYAAKVAVWQEISGADGGGGAVALGKNGQSDKRYKASAGPQRQGLQGGRMEQDQPGQGGQEPERSAEECRDCRHVGPLLMASFGGRIAAGLWESGGIGAAGPEELVQVFRDDGGEGSRANARPTSSSIG